MSTFWWIVIIAAILVAGLLYLRYRTAAASRSLTDSASGARRWVERLGGHVYSLDPTGDPAARQALGRRRREVHRGWRAGRPGNVRAAVPPGVRGPVYGSAARTALGLDPGPQLPPIPGQQQAGAVSEGRSVAVEGRQYTASPSPGEGTQHYYPGGLVAGRPLITPAARASTRGLGWVTARSSTRSHRPTAHGPHSTGSSLPSTVYLPAVVVTVAMPSSI